MSDEDRLAKHFSPRLLFGGALRWITPMLWVAYIFSSMAVFFLATWTPLVFEALSYSRPEAAAAGSITAIAGALGGLALMRFTDTFGAIAVAAMPALAIPLLLLGGFADVGHGGFMVLIGLIAFALIGGHFGLHSIAGIFYPSAWRGNGAGWATSVAKVGSIAGPFLGGLILATSLPVRHIFALMAVCPAMVLLCMLVVGRLHSRMLREGRRDGAPAAVSVT
jgi:AAHS family 4-hydroxybenzoate transporter-like MFS transporter